jgi:hypothetical protein
MVGETIEQSRRHLRVAEHARPFAKGEIGRDDHRGPLIETADQMEQELSASLGERQVTEFIEDDEVDAREIVGETTGAAGPTLCLQPVDEIDGVEEPTTRPATDATASDRHREVCLAGAGPADQHDVALLGDEAATGEIAHQAFVDWRVVEGEAIDILGQRQLGDRQLVLDRARLLLRDLGLEQIAREALRFMPTFERGGEDLVPRVWLRQPEDRLRRSSSQIA